MSWHHYKPYVSVAKRKAIALREMDKLRKQGKDIQPIQIQGRKIAKNFWGEAWCEHLESFSDYENRLPRGRTYARNGSVCHLDIQKGEVSAIVSGSELYNIDISIKSLSPKKWKAVKKGCTNQISSLLELLQGKIPDSVLETVTNQQEGLFPSPREISFQCDCPDYASMCKHISAVLYGVGARLDHSPELLFELRGVDVEELIDRDAEVASATSDANNDKRNRIAVGGLGDVFGIEIDEDVKKTLPPKRRQKKKSPPKKKTAAARKPSSKKKVHSRKRSVTISRLKPVTGREVWDLRFKFDMSQTQFARIVGVSTGSVVNWEKRIGQLNMREASLRSFKQVKKLSIKKAREELEQL